MLGNNENKIDGWLGVAWLFAALITLFLNQTEKNKNRGRANQQYLNLMMRQLTASKPHWQDGEWLILMKSQEKLVDRMGIEPTTNRSASELHGPKN